MRNSSAGLRTASEVAQHVPMLVYPTALACWRADVRGVQASRSEPEAGLEERLDDGVLMAIAHRTRPHWGVQFHPESIATCHGSELLQNFAGCTLRDIDSRGPQHMPGELSVANIAVWVG